ncbi:Sll0314/Alr1548 family TPR repeat-containing protein [Crocosphaera sp. UHCC 0190]|uniref:Sll0314/Alr1548 family TPR repeat-containing protein n=1 Tax=Crocosphaera sp. UHCC 0190 TaxID=3110246 RepID=UPI002B21D656|nr:Sll0314/Alr1548 family TPR repeat-containing protein [Crocosphaera sp. UHCC 0190]MEA5510455.1 Sll0314/Alr1548 family TPR repeat-containing protein [Crocosphaera sp. UHCC 0190]
MIDRLIKSQRVSLSLSVVCTVALSMWGNPSWAGDPFRSSNPRPIGDKTEAAFETIFHQGNYVKAESYLQEAIATEGDEPLAHAMKASLAYADSDFETMRVYAEKTLSAAEKLTPKDPLRGNLYQAVGHFLEGAYTFKTKGPLGAVDKLQKVFDYLELAEKVSPSDPELNLLKGYLDLILSVNLPFSSPEDAISRFEKYAGPDYMVNRALAAAYRDLKQYDTAIKYIDQALKDTPDNPEIQYLKGQILRKKGRTKDGKPQDLVLLKEAYTYFEKAMIKVDQLPEGLQIPLRHDHRVVQDEIAQLAANPR